MKNYIVILILLFQISISSYCQKAGDRLPDFHMVLPNGLYFSSQNIKVNTPILYIYFSPDCEHCKELMDAFFRRVTDFNKTEVVLITFDRGFSLIDFIKKYNIDKYSNIYVGTEIPFYFNRYYFRLSNTPFVALYNSRKQLVNYFRKPPQINQIIQILKNNH